MFTFTLPAYRTFWVLVSWDDAIHCLPSSFQNGISGNSFVLQWLCTSESHLLPFCVTTDFLIQWRSERSSTGLAMHAATGFHF